MSKRDYYEILGVPRDATTDQIKKAFKKKAMEFHPDRNPGDNTAREKFEEAKEAEEVLCDVDKRLQYDKFGHAGPKAQTIWEDLFNAHFNTHFNNTPISRKGNDLKVNVKLTLEEIYTGVKKKFNINRREKCTSCGGHGGSNPKMCGTCGGSGTVVQTIDLGFAHTMAPGTCPKCNGYGEIIENPCGTCNGNGFVMVSDSFDVTIPEGVAHGVGLIIPGKGDAIRNGVNGDLLIGVIEIPHQYYTRQAADLKRTLALTYPQLILGHKMEFTTIDGGKIRFEIPAHTKVGDIFRLKGKGMKYVNANDNSIITGDLLLVIDIIIPTSITEEERNLIIELKKVNEKVATN